MVKQIRLIGTGLGHSAHLTRAAAVALGTVDVVLVVDGDADAQRTLVSEVLQRQPLPRFAEATTPLSPLAREGNSAAYGEALLAGCLDALGDLTPDEQIVGILVPGLPRVEAAADQLAHRLADHFGAGVEVVPGLAAAQLLAAAHGISLAQDDENVRLVSAEGLSETYEPADGVAVVVGDPDLRCLELTDLYPDLNVYWGARLGRDDEVLVAGRLDELTVELPAACARAQAAGPPLLDAYIVRPAETRARPGPAPWPALAELTDGVLTLRPVTTEDWPTVLAENNDEESLRWSLTGERLTEAQARQRAAGARREWVRGRAARLTMVDRATGRAAGQLGVLRMGPPEVGIIGYGVLPEFRGRGFTTRALRLVADWVFSTTSIGRLELGHKVDNVASGVVAARAGFVREAVLAGRLRNADGSFSDEVVYARVRP